MADSSIQNKKTEFQEKLGLFGIVILPCFLLFDLFATYEFVFAVSSLSLFLNTKILLNT